MSVYHSFEKMKPQLCFFLWIQNMSVYHSFEKMKPQLCFFLKKPSLVNIVTLE